MLAPPSDLNGDALATALADGWGIDSASLDYLPVGFGSHHWRARDADGQHWFVTVDEHRDPGTVEDLRRAFFSAFALRRDAGLEFILAPVPAADGGILRVVLDGRFTVAVTPWIDAAPLGTHEFTSAADRLAVLELLGRLHAATPRIGPKTPESVDLTLPDGDHLRAAIDHLHQPDQWATGPFGEPVRGLLLADLGRVTMALARYDELSAAVRADRSIPWVVTHGEPHQANVLRDSDGSLHLIDWDTGRIAPRERDLWMVLDDSSDPAAYRAGGDDDAPFSPLALRLFRMRWDLGEIGTYVREFRSVHSDDANTRESWNNLRTYLPVAEDHLIPDTCLRLTPTRRSLGTWRALAMIAGTGAGSTGRHRAASVSIQRNYHP